ncbi:TerC family protein [Evansella tamaricis]|uniref:TerC family protein n=1 Tax=Evansella tamaricis TaxID=2069301 RepID=A0ABS6JHQ7_9BACI|nr:hypothetical protein [Evansella tamaricis]MBU9713126.1 hypothetical protein [Evansella tamaricis]
MHTELLMIFLISVITDLDNIVIYLYFLKKKPTILFIAIFVGILSLNRTIYVSFVHQLTNIPGIHILIGLFILFIAFKMTTKQFAVDRRRRTNVIKTVGTILVVDFFLSIDGVILITNVSDTYSLIFVGIAMSLFLLLLFSPLVFHLLKYFPWFYLLAGTFIGYTGTKSIISDPYVHHWIMVLNHKLPGVDVINLFSLCIALLLFVIGIGRRIGNDRIVKVK